MLGASGGDGRSLGVQVASVHFQKGRQYLMSTEYRYNTVYFANNLWCAVPLLFGGIVLLGAFIQEGGIASPVVALPLLLLLFGTWIAYIPYRLAGMTFQITEDAVLRRSRKGVRSFPLKEVQLKLRADVLHLQHQSGTSICVNVFWLRDFRGFFADLEERLDAKHLSSHYDALDMSQWSSLAGRWDAIEKYLEVRNAFIRPMGVVMLNVVGSWILGFVIGTRGWGEAFSAIWPFLIGLWFVLVVMPLSRSGNTVIRQQRTDPEGRIKIDRDDVIKCIFRNFTQGTLIYVALSVAFAAAMYYKVIGDVSR